MLIPSKFAALAAALLLKNYQTYSLVKHQTENSSYSLSNWVVSNSIMVLCVQTKKAFPPGFYAAIRYFNIWLPMLFFKFHFLIRELIFKIQVWLFFVFFYLCPSKCCNAMLLFICADLGRKPTTKEVEVISKCFLTIRKQRQGFFWSNDVLYL